VADEGWIVRNKLVWHKPAPMPASVRDRFTCSWEPLYLLSRSRSYNFNLDAVRVPHKTTARPRQGKPAKYGGASHPSWAGPLAGSNDGVDKVHAEGRVGHPLGRNPGDVMTIATAGFRGAHFATFPPRLIERPILAGCPERVCQRCTAGWLSVDDQLEPACLCEAGWRPGRVLDPFMGAGTVALVAERHGRHWLGIELNPAYRDLALERLRQDGAGR
jgi:DNA modification methylase